MTGWLDAFSWFPYQFSNTGFENKAKMQGEGLQEEDCGVRMWSQEMPRAAGLPEKEPRGLGSPICFAGKSWDRILSLLFQGCGEWEGVLRKVAILVTPLRMPSQRSSQLWCRSHIWELPPVRVTFLNSTWVIELQAKDCLGAHPTAGATKEEWKGPTSLLGSRLQAGVGG